MVAQSLPKPEIEKKVLLLLGFSGAGKSTAGNFIAGEEHFSIRGSSLTEQTTMHKFEYDGTKVHLIDTVGYDEMSKSGKEVMKELTAAVLMDIYIYIYIPVDTPTHYLSKYTKSPPP